MADGDSLRQLFCVFGLDFRVCAWYCTALLSDAGDVPVPVCRWFRTCFHRLFSRFELRESKNGCF